MILSAERYPKTANSVADNQVSRERVVTKKVSENCELDNDTRFAGIIDGRLRASVAAIALS